VKLASAISSPPFIFDYAVFDYAVFDYAVFDYAVFDYAVLTMLLNQWNWCYNN
jgi:hypothetical protein